eukprot:m.57486 g.57486  ORF g.57486 m.57486 type:complete len:89 (+) comp34748_c0_seq2:723-989(+)
MKDLMMCRCFDKSRDQWPSRKLDDANLQDSFTCTQRPLLILWTCHLPVTVAAGTKCRYMGLKLKERFVPETIILMTTHCMEKFLVEIF